MAGGKVVQDGLNFPIGKGGTVAEVPGFGIETLPAVVGTAGNEEGHPDAGAVGHINGPQVGVVHL